MFKTNLSLFFFLKIFHNFRFLKNVNSRFPTRRSRESFFFSPGNSAWGRIDRPAFRPSLFSRLRSRIFSHATGVFGKSPRPYDSMAEIEHRAMCLGRNYSSRLCSFRIAWWLLINRWYILEWTLGSSVGLICVLYARGKNKILGNHGAGVFNIDILLGEFLVIVGRINRIK